MEKEKNESPKTLQVQGQPTESEINIALGVADASRNQSSVPVITRKWIFGKKSSMHYRHRKIDWTKTSPLDVEHISDGKRRGCQCSACKVARKEFEDISGVDLSPGAPGVAPLPSEPVGKKSGAVDASLSDGAESEQDSPGSGKIRQRELDEFLVDIVDEETCGILLDTFRKSGEIYYRGKYGKLVESTWAQDDKELLVLGRLGKKVFDKYASVPNFKHKELALLGFFLAQSVGLRVAATLKIVKEVKQ